MSISRAKGLNVNFINYPRYNNCHSLQLTAPLPIILLAFITDSLWFLSRSLVMRESHFKIRPYPWCEWLSRTLFLWNMYEIWRNNSVFGVESNTKQRNKITAIVRIRLTLRIWNEKWNKPCNILRILSQTIM